jgi:hypothetical protein
MKINKKIYIYLFILILLLTTYLIVKILNIKENFIHNKEKNYICYYTVFIGSNNNVAFKIPKLPSQYYDCYYYTNNKKLYDLLQNTKWKSKLLEIPVSDDEIKSAMDAKHLKARPDLYDDLNKYNYTVYFDSKLNLNCDSDIENIIDTKMKQYPMILRRHNNLKNVWEEFDESMTQERYKKEKYKYITYINKNLEKGLSATAKNHYVTNFIIRDNKNPIVKEINKTWYEHILECGIECQISFSFIQQIYSDYIDIIEYDQFRITY